MRVVVNQLAALGFKTGIGHYTVELLRCLREQAGEDVVDAYPEGWFRRLRVTANRLRPHLEGRARGSTPRPTAAAPAAKGFRRRLLAQLRRSARTLTGVHFRAVYARRHYDLYHEPNFIPLPGDRPTVATLHDLSVLLHPEWHPADRVAFFEEHFERSLARCVHFLAISEFGRQELIRELGIAPERVTCTYMGIRPGLAPLPAAAVARTLEQLGLPRQYLLCLGTIEPRKNVLTLLRAYCALPERLRSRWPLLLVGGWGWNAGDVAAYLADEARHRGVLHLGYVAEEHLAVLYNGARALVYPSRYEGFGLPPVEMMACGGAVLASTAGAVVETVGGRAHLVPPDDLGGWHDALGRVLQDDDWWRSLRRDVTGVARPFTWDRCAADTLRVYRALAGAPAGLPLPQRPSGPEGLRAAG